MSDERLVPQSLLRSYGREVVPLFCRRRTRKNGECDEISVGPSAVCIVRWFVVLLLALLLSMAGVGPARLCQLLLRAVP